MQAPQPPRSRQPRSGQEIVNQNSTTTSRHLRKQPEYEVLSTMEPETSESESRYGFRTRDGKHPRFCPCCTDYVQKIQIRRTRSNRTSTNRARGGGG